MYMNAKRGLTEWKEIVRENKEDMMLCNLVELLPLVFVDINTHEEDGQV